MEFDQQAQNQEVMMNQGQNDEEPQKVFSFEE
jgi:hypothetical protein